MVRGKGGEKISKRISKYVENFANKRQDEITNFRPRRSSDNDNTRSQNNCKTPNTKRLKLKETDRFIFGKKNKQKQKTPL
jgi:hypothetical protein